MALDIQFLGHSAFLLADGTHTLLIDPFLTGNPTASTTAQDIRCTHIALSHGHSDHIGDTVSIAQRCDAVVVAPFETANYLGEQGLAHVESGNPGGRVKTSFGSVSFVQAFHSSSYEGRYMGAACGLIISMGGKCMYHCGDTALFGDMKLIGELYKPDIAAVPIGDRFTMDASQGARAAELIGAPVAVPIHYRTFPLLAQSADGFTPRGVQVQELMPGEHLRLE
ncbi:MAG: metal-dependent hydrolase [Spirochaetaceae bacterium]|nr:MAG: metal-dependent hydrolase [Spirochaetaceae bacterium]